MLSGERDERHFQALEGFEQADDFFGFAAVGDSEHGVAAGEHAEVAVDGFGGMQEEGRRAGAGESGGDFAGDEAGFAHAGDDDAAFAGEEEIDGFLEGGVEASEDVLDGLGFDLEDAAGGVEAHVGAPAADELREFFEACEQGGELREREGVGAVGEGGGGIVVGFEENAVDAGGDAGAGERFDEFGLAAAGVALAAGELHGVRDVEDDRIAEFVQDREGAHVDDEILVAEGGAAFGEDDFVVAGGGDFFDDVGHVPRGDELGFLDVDDAAGFGGGERGDRSGARGRREFAGCRRLRRRARPGRRRECR